MWSRISALGVLIFCCTLLIAAPANDEPAKIDPAMAKDLLPRVVTIKNEKILLSKALKIIKDQTDIEVVPPADMDPEIKLELERVPFWQALDKIAKEADVRLSLYGREGKVALVAADGGFREMPVSYSGIFRVCLKRVVVVRDLDTDSHLCMARLEIAWEPRFQAFLLETKPQNLEVKDDKGIEKEVPEGGSGQTPADRRIALEMDLRLPAFPRKVANIGSIKGQLSMIGSPKLLTFTFDKLAKGESKKLEDVTVTLKNFREDKEHWLVDFSLQYPPGGPKFESFQNWLINNETYLLNNAGKRLRHQGYETDDSGATVASIRYHFIDDDQGDIKLGKPKDWKLIYRTPGKIVEVPIKFEFKDVPLP